MIDHDPDHTPPLANSGVVDVRSAGSSGPRADRVSGAAWRRGTESEIAHGAWRACSEPEDDGDGFTTTNWFARHRWTGEERILHHSRFRFHMTPERFAWLVDKDFPRHPRGNWDNASIDEAMKGEPA